MCEIQLACVDVAHAPLLVLDASRQHQAGGHGRQGFAGNFSHQSAQDDDRHNESAQRDGGGQQRPEGFAAASPEAGKAGVILFLSVIAIGIIQVRAPNLRNQIQNLASNFRSSKSATLNPKL